jgi:hypothetical protein
VGHGKKKKKTEPPEMNTYNIVWIATLLATLLNVAMAFLTYHFSKGVDLPDNFWGNLISVMLQPKSALLESSLVLSVLVGISVFLAIFACRRMPW